MVRGPRRHRGPQPSCSRRSPEPESRRTWCLGPAAPVTIGRGPGGQGLGTGRGSGGCHPVPFSRWRRESGPEAAAPLPCPGSRVGCPQPESGRVPGRGRRDARGPADLPCWPVGAAAGGSCVPRGGTWASGRCEFGELRPPRLPEPGNGGRRRPGEPCCLGTLVSALESGVSGEEPENNPTQLGRRSSQTVEPFERALLFASLQTGCSLKTCRLFKL